MIILLYETKNSVLLTSTCGGPNICQLNKPYSKADKAIIRIGRKNAMREEAKKNNVIQYPMEASQCNDIGACE
jgi:hypothetical protein